MEHKADWNLFKERTSLVNGDDLAEHSTVDDLVSLFNNHIRNAADAAIPKSSGVPKPQRVPWWNQECSEAIRNRKKAQRKYQRSLLIVDGISYKRCKALAKNVLNKAKKTSWKNYVSSINSNTPMSKIWKRIRKIRGIYQNILSPCLVVDDEPITEKDEVAEIMASHYASISSNNSYDPRFRRARQTLERNLNFDTCEELPYNNPISILELERMLSSSSKSATGEDQVSYNMISRSHPSCKTFLLKIFNKILSSGDYPSEWRTSLVLSFPKPGKIPNCPENFRPISLTSCTGKLLEKIINTRITIFLEAGNHIPKHQFGFRKMQSTSDALNKFISDVGGALNMKQHVLCVSFDLRKAYDSTWRYGIMKAIHQTGMRGNVPRIIQNFLSNRTFKTKIRDTTSNIHNLEQGVPQGSVLSCTLFSLAINGILESVPNGVEAILYVDDLLIYCSGTYVPSLERRLQNAINKIESWATSHGFTFSPAKTNCIHFHRKRKSQPPLKLTLNNRIIVNREHIKYLGMMIDYRLEWKTHIQNLKTNCIRRLDLLKCLSHTSWGSDRTILLRLYRAIVRSKMDYGSFLYNTAREGTLKMLDPVHNAAIRLCTGAYRSSPVISLYADSGEPSLQRRRDQLLLQYHSRTLQLPTSAAYPYMQQPIIRTEIRTNTITDRIGEVMESLEIDIRTVPFRFRDIPVWQLASDVRCNTFEYPKKGTCSDYIMRCYFNEHIENHHRGQFPIYTDGAKSEEGVGCAAVSLGGSKKLKLRSESSIFTAELCGIICALNMVKTLNRREFVILCDSRSAIQISDHYESTHPLIHKIVVLFLKLNSMGKIVKLCWCPAHVGIVGNERADKMAKDASLDNGPAANNAIPYKDWYPIIKSKVRDEWDDEWRMVQANKLRSIKNNVRPWLSADSYSRKISIIITRLRIGHTKMTHQYLMEQGPQPYCGDCLVPLTVEHLLAECPSHSDIRNQIYPECVNKGPGYTMKIMLEESNDSFDIERIMRYLRETGTVDEII